MTPEEARKLLGGYATGTLTETEEQALFAAALEDQSLFDELAREQSLRDLLRDPAAKGRLLASLDEPRRTWWRSWKPAAVLAMAGVAAFAVVVGTRTAPAPVRLVAKVEVPAAQPPVSAPPAPMRQQAVSVPERRDAPRPAAKRQFTLPSVSEPKAAPVELADAPKADALKSEAAVPGGVVGGVIAPAAPPARNLSVTPMLERPSDTRVHSFAAEMAVAAPPSARDMFLAGSATPVRVRAVAAAQPAGVQALGLRYSVERREGEASVAIRFTSNINAYLSIGGAGPVALTAMRSYTTPPLAGDEVKVVFSRRPETSVAGAVVPVTQVSGGETYVVSPAGAALSFTIPLKPQ